MAALLLILLPMHLQAQFGSQTVGQIRTATVTVTAQSVASSDTVTSVEVLTMGSSGLDFTTTSGSSCQGITLARNATCQQTVTFTPTTPGLRMGAVVLMGSSGLMGTAYLSGTGQGGLGVLVPGNLIPVAGSGAYLGSIYDGYTATLAELYLPTSVAIDGSGNLYIADSLHNRIRKVTASTGVISTICGNGNPAYSGDGGLATSATLNTPSGVALDGAGNLYIADTGNNVIRMITAANGNIETVAGMGPPTQAGYNRDGIAATSAQLNQPQGVTVDGSGNLYIADTNNQRIRLVSASTGLISTVAGNGFTNTNGSGGYSGDGGLAAAAELNSPYAVAFNASGNMYIPDSANNRVRVVDASTHIINTFAGTGVTGYSGDGGPATAAMLWAPSGVAVDAAGNVFIADTQNSAIRKVSTATTDISTLIITGSGTYYFNSTFSRIGLYGPIGLTLDEAGNLFVADTLNMVVREVQGNFVAVDLITPVRQGSKSTPQSQTVENDGNAALDLTVIANDANSALDSTTTTCETGTASALASESACIIGAVFAPSVAGNPLTAVINVGAKGDTANAPLAIDLVGDATAVNSTSISVSTSLTPSNYGSPVTFTAIVTTGSGTGSLTGTVNFYDGSTPLASNVVINGSGSTATASYTSSTLAVGAHSITASYSGDSTHFSSLSTDPNKTIAPLVQIVNEATTTVLKSSLNPVALNASVTFTATVAAPAGGGVTPAGSVTFYDGLASLGTGTLSSSGVATYATSTLTAGVHSITATYPGNSATHVLGSTSATLSQSVQAPSTGSITSSLNPAPYGGPVTFTATIQPSGSAAPTGTITFYDGTTQIGIGTLSGSPAIATFTTTSLAIGSHSIYASYGGDSSNGASQTTTLPQTISTTTTQTTLSASPLTGIAGASESLKASVAISSGAGTPTGTVTFSSNGVTIGSAALSSASTATLNWVFAPGTYSILATYSGDNNDGGSQSTLLPLTVTQATTTTAVSVSPNPGVVVSPVTFTATVSGAGSTPSGTVTFYAGTTSLGTATLNSAGKATLTNSTLAVGSYAISATYSGDTNNQTSTGTAAGNLVITTISTVTSLGSAVTVGTTPQLILVATVVGASGPTPTGTVTFTTTTGTTLGSTTLDSSGVATFFPNVTGGAYSVVATYAGDTVHAGSVSQSLGVTAPASNFSVGVSPSSVSVASSQNITVAVTLTASNGYSDTIGLGCASLPAGVTCHFSPVSVALAANGTASSQLTIDTGNPLTGGSSASNRSAMGSRTAWAGLALPFGLALPISLFFGGLWLRFRRRNAAWLLLLLAVVVSSVVIPLAGCGSFTPASAAPGTYTIQVTGTGVNSGEIHEKFVTLTITK
ncbi:MAG: Ig-like domain repeat protein [Terracidiphilus sp.]|nr:Ig-like domain repeat protein [Terracidiphilus sp.]